MRLLSHLSLNTKLNIIHTLKLSIALLVGFFIIKRYYAPHDIWVVISIIIVMTTHRSLAIQINKAMARIFGTCIGAALGIVIVLLNPPIWLNAAALVVVSIVFSVFYYKKFLNDYAFILGLATYAMVAVNSHATWQLGVERAGEIMVGILVALVISLLIYPVHSKTMLKLLINKSWLVLDTLATDIIVEKKNRFDSPEIMQLEQTFLQQHQQVEVLMKTKTILKILHTGNDFTLESRYQLAMYRYLIQLEVFILDEYIDDELTDTLLLLQQIIAHLDKPEFTNMVGDYCIRLEAMKSIVVADETNDKIEEHVALMFTLKRFGILFRRIILAK